MSGKASASDSRLVTSFLDGRLRFSDEGFAFDFSIREIRADRLIMRLSLLVVLKTLVIPLREFVDVLVIVLGILLIVGAWDIQQANSR